MKIHALQLRNFRQHAETSVTLEPTGITGIVGSNESGKSTLLEAVAWGLFGSKAVRGTKDGLRWKRAPVRHVAAVDLDFEVGGKRYRVERSETNAKLFEGSVPVAEGTSAVDDYVPGLLGMSLREFEASYMCAQKDLGRLAAMGPTERQTFVRSVMGLDRIDVALERIRKRKNDLGRELEGLSAGLGERAPLAQELEEAREQVALASDQAEDLSRAAGALDDDHEALAGRLLTLDQAKERHDQLEQGRREARADADRTADELTTAQGELAAAEAAADRVAEVEERLERLPGLRARRDQLLKAKERAENRGRLDRIIHQLKDDIDQLSARIEKLDAATEAHDQEELERVAREFSAVEEELQQLRSDRERERVEAKARSDAAGARRQELRDQVATLQELGKEGPCPTCTRPLGGHLDDVLAALKAAAAAADAECRSAARVALDRSDPSAEETALANQLERLRRVGEQLKEARTRARDAEQEIGPLRMQLEDRRKTHAAQVATAAAVGAIPLSGEQLQEVEEEIAALERLERHVAAWARAQAALAQPLRERIERLRSGHAAALTWAANATDELERLGYDVDAHQEFRSERERLGARLETVRRDLARTEERLQAAADRRDRAERSLQEYDARAEQLADLREELRIHTAAAERVNDFRVEQASLIRPELEELTSGFVSVLTDGRHDAVTVTEDFEVVLQEAGLTTEVISGGTEDLAAIALRLAISQMIAERAGHPLSLLILDEPFGSLDEVRRGNVLTLIRQLSGTFEQVLVISHVAETRDAVDHVVELEYDEAEGRSRVVNAHGGAPAEAAA